MKNDMDNNKDEYDFIPGKFGCMFMSIILSISIVGGCIWSLFANSPNLFECMATVLVACFMIVLLIVAI